MFNRILIFLDRFHWLWLALATPFLLFPSPNRSLAMLVVPALFLLRWLAFRTKKQTVPQDKQVTRSIHESVIPNTPLNGVLLLMMIMVLVSLWATPDINNSLPKISGMVLGIGVYFAVVREGACVRGWFFGWLGFLGMGLGIATVSIFGTSWVTSKIPLLNPVIARLPKLITGLQGANLGLPPAEVAGALIWVLPMMMVICIALVLLTPKIKAGEALAYRNGGQEKFHGWRLAGVTILFLGATFLIFAIFLLSQSRAGYIGLILTLPVMILIALPPRWRWYYLAILVAFAIVSGILIGSHWETVRVWVSGIDLTASTAISTNSLDQRLEVWSRAIYGIQDFPFTGMGMNIFREVVRVLYPLISIPSQMDIGHAHNEFLQVALDLGIPGLIAFLSLYIGCFWMLATIWKISRPSSFVDESPSKVIRLIALGLGGGLLAHLLYGMTDAVALGAKPGVLFWMLLGLITGLHKQARENWTAVGGM